MSSQVFSVHPRNPRCFVYRGRPFKVLTSAEHYGAVLNADFDYDVYLEEMQRTGQNATRVFTFYRETAASIPGPGPMNTLAPTPEGSVMPWERVAGRGKAADGLDRFDLDRWNAAYFERLKAFVGKCGDRGVVCEIVLFCNPYDQGKYDLFPCSRVSNVNGVGEDLDRPQGFMTLDAPSITVFQERFVRKMAEELNPFDNVYYEICNEPNFSGDSPEAAERKVVAWHARIARVLREAEAGLPHRHLIAANAHCVVKVSGDPSRPVVRHEDLSYFENPDIDVVNYHYISRKAVAQGLHFFQPPGKAAYAGLTWHFLRERDRFEKPVVFDETFSGVVRGAPERLAVNRAEAWEMILSGGAGYSNLDWSFTQADETGAGKVPIGDGRRLDWRPLRAWLHVFRRLLEQYDLAALVPAVGLVSGEVPGCGHAAATDGRGRYILYLVDEKMYQLEACEPRRATLSLALPAGQYSVKAFDPRTGEVREIPEVHSAGPARLEVPAFNEDVAVLLNMES
ncbi:MAG: hypothetical protein A3F84_29510 [Candidatus Handelsmanbacteria bacterium RIFCSPLOWO2_12_FULL_64_10]|uniref:Glycoside hydrolase family 5 domain-containing protein n=1 Tax=Handelsmanbacteria sp. (strain RIFCSPLOWO2_12_FULL_64_10) TaxID=1817868 RepID=A0A1F6CHT6_HANXR|nr:MAG: hypothetical protein A3F84_29510 [Candidatus Handelsmanbacteria bacterium RIFCSPLOWO2_12_FULL_64_10]